MDPIAYTYEADMHCPYCTEARFGKCDRGVIACPDHSNETGDTSARDREGNPVGAAFSWEVEDDDRFTCGTCGVSLF